MCLYCLCTVSAPSLIARGRACLFHRGACSCLCCRFLAYLDGLHQRLSFPAQTRTLAAHAHGRQVLELGQRPGFSGAVAAEDVAAHAAVVLANNEGENKAARFALRHLRVHSTQVVCFVQLVVTGAVYYCGYCVWCYYCERAHA